MQSRPVPAAPAAAIPAASSPAVRSVIVGKASYVASPCANSPSAPACSGPYRRARVALWSHATTQWLRNSVTDDEGRYRFEIDPGVYTVVLETGNDRDPYWFAKVNVPPFETLTQDLVVELARP